MASGEGSSQAAAAKRSNGLLPFSETVAELKKVHKPTRQETIQASIEVFLMVGLLSLYLGLADFLLGSLMRYILR